MMKFMLQKVNKQLLRYNNSQTPSLWIFLHKWKHEHSFTKNLLQICNRILKGANKYHFFRWDWMVGIAGAFAGFLVTQIQQLYFQIKIGYKPTVSELVIHKVLKNQSVSNKLKDTLDQNVFRNQDIQFYIHQALLNQILHPQKQSIKLLIKQYLNSMNSEENVQYFGRIFSQKIYFLKQPIKTNALTFLNSTSMDQIAANGLKSVLQSLFFKQFLSNQINQYIKSMLKDPSNSDNLYQSIKFKISF